MDKVFLVLDIGTSYLKCGCIDYDLNILSIHQRIFPMIHKGNSYELDFDLFYETTTDLIKECLSDEIIKSYKVEMLLITSQAQTFTAVDENFQPLCNGIVWLDERAKVESEYLSKQLRDFSASSGFAYPMSSLYVSKLLWLKSNNASVYNKAKYFPLINEFLVRKLTGEFYSDTTSFGMSGMYDFRYESLNKDLLAILELEEKHFPFITKAAIKGEVISDEIKEEWGLKNNFSIYLCGNDQGASACGAGLKHPGDLNINFGTAMVFYSVTKTLTKNLTNDQIAGKHPLGDTYFLLNFESDYGIKIRMLKEKFFKNDTYDKLFQTYQLFPNEKEQIPNSALDEKHFTSIEVHRYTAGVIKYYLTRLKIHIEQIQKIVPIKKITLSGGMMKSEIWLDILKNNLQMPFSVNNRAEAGLLGAIDIYIQNNRIN